MAEGKALVAFMKIYGKLPKGGEIIGEALDKKYSAAKGWFEINSFNWGLDHKEAASSADAGGGVTASHHQLDVKDVTLTKYVDQSSPMLLLACCEYPRFDKARVVFLKAGRSGDRGTFSYIGYQFTGVRVKSVDWKIESEVPDETVIINFETVQFKYRPQQVSGERGSTMIAGWNLGDANSPQGSRQIQVAWPDNEQDDPSMAQ